MSDSSEPGSRGNSLRHFSVDSAVSRGSIPIMAAQFSPRLFRSLGRRMLASFLVVALSATLASAADVPSLGEAGLGSGSHSSMHMMVEKTFLKVDVATIDVKVGAGVQEKFKQALGGKPYSPSAEGALARIALDADRAVIQLKFVRSVALDQWIDGVRESLAQAERAGLISAALRRQVSEGLPVWFQPVKERGYKDGDRVLYRIDPGGLRAVAVTREGQVLVDRADVGQDKSRVVLASYFAPGTDYRQLLLSSLK